MKVTFISNFMNHHQLPFSQEMVKLLGKNYKFVVTEKIPQERIEMGYEDMNKKYDFIIRSYENEEEVYKLANESDIVIFGSAPRKYINKRIKNNISITLAYSERIFKKTDCSYIPRKLYHKYIKDRIQNKNFYLLCSSAYAANDYNSINKFKNKTYKWGYFTEIKEYNNIDNLIKTKEENSIIWVGRFIKWKHPEIVIEIAKKLKKDNYNFTIKMIGVGKQFNKIKKMIKHNNLGRNVILLGSMPQEKVRSYMEKSKIFLFTSNRNEGWGAVLNESMNSACAVVASHEIGSVPFLIDNNKNGLIYEDGNLNDLYYKVKSLLDNEELTNKIGKQAYNTMINLWNPKVAAKRIIELSEELLQDKSFNKYEEGPCSKAYRIKDNWYKKLKRIK